MPSVSVEHHAAGCRLLPCAALSPRVPECCIRVKQEFEFHVVWKIEVLVYPKCPLSYLVCEHHIYLFLRRPTLWVRGCLERSGKQSLCTHLLCIEIIYCLYCSLYAASTSWETTHDPLHNLQISPTKPVCPLPPQCGQGTSSISSGSYSSCSS